MDLEVAGVSRKFKSHINDGRRDIRYKNGKKPLSAPWDGNKLTQATQDLQIIKTFPKMVIFHLAALAYLQAALSYLQFE